MGQQRLGAMNPAQMTGNYGEFEGRRREVGFVRLVADFGSYLLVSAGPAAAAAAAAGEFEPPFSHSFEL